MRKLRILALSTLLTVTAGCSLWSTSDRAQLWSINSRFRVTLYGGTQTRTWISDGKVRTESSSDGFYFAHKGKLVRVSGNLAIEEIEDSK